MNDDDNVLSLFRGIDATPFRMLCQAKTLFASYKFLQANFRIPIENDHLASCTVGMDQEPAMMLFGFAYENLLKAYIAHNAGGALDAKGNLAEHIKGHDLNELYSRARGNAPAPDLEVALTGLGTFSTWAGRYSHPTKAKDWKLIGVNQINLLLLEDNFGVLLRQILVEIRPEFYNNL